VKLRAALLLVAAAAFPKFTAPVVDAAGVVPDDAEQRVDAQLNDYQQRSGNQIAVAVVKTTGDQSLEDYSIDLAREWGVGTKGKDNGVLLLIAYDDRMLRIEVGRGLEGDLTDLESGHIRDDMISFMREGDVGGAITVGTQEIRRALGDTQSLPAEPPPPSDDTGRRSSGNWLWVAPFFLLPFFGRMFRNRTARSTVFWGGGNVHDDSRRDAKRRKRRREADHDWLGTAILAGLLLGGGRNRGGFGGGDFGGGGGGDFGGGGGGDFGGGGASGGW
jgi:uncharacterized protein